MNRLLAAVALCAAASLQAQQSAPVTNVGYEISADRAALAAHRLHVTTSFDVAGTAPVLLSLPAWTPGAYEISNFARWVSGFRPTQNGVPLRWDKVDYDTWRLIPTGAGSVRLTYDVAADSLDNAMAWTRPDFALFNGTTVFMYPEGRPLEFASTVRIVTEPEFRIATGLTSTGARQFASTSYHELVDNPVFMGRFDFDSASISGKTVRLATYPMGSVARERRAEVWEQLKRVIPPEVAVFGEAPWANYTVMQIIDSTFQGASGLEHASSHVDIGSPDLVGSDFQPSLYAHEIFHSWNVKRLRPADMVPYHYDREQPTPWLWVSEGITDYYADLAEVRGGVVDVPGFYALVAGKIGEIAGTVPFALEDASLNTWIHPTDGTGYSYYPKGSLAGLMLDIMIRDASNNRNSLDTVMRELYGATYRQGRGFTHDEWWGAVSRAAGGRSFEDFERKYVDGRDPYPWTTMLATIGLRLVSDSTPRIGVNTGPGAGGTIMVADVSAGGAAAIAGVLAGDVMVSVGDIPVADQDFGAKFRFRFAGRAAGTPYPVVVQRAGVTRTLSARLQYGDSGGKIVEEAGAPAKAVRLRNGILRGMVSNER